LAEIFWIHRVSNLSSPRSGHPKIENHDRKNCYMKAAAERSFPYQAAFPKKGLRNGTGRDPLPSKSPMKMRSCFPGSQKSRETFLRQEPTRSPRGTDPSWSMCSYRKGDDHFHHAPKIRNAAFPSPTGRGKNFRSGGDLGDPHSRLEGKEQLFREQLSPGELRAVGKVTHRPGISPWREKNGEGGRKRG